MAKIAEMFYGFAHAGEVIDADVSRSRKIAISPRINHGNVDLGVLEILLHAKGKHRDSFHLPLLHAGGAGENVVRMPFRIREADQNFVAFFNGGAFEVEDDFRKEGISTAEFGNYQADGMASATSQRARLVIR